MNQKNEKMKREPMPPKAPGGEHHPSPVWLGDGVFPWQHLPNRHVYELKDLSYTEHPTVPKVQILHIFVPEEYLREDGSIADDGRCGHYSARSAPVVFENNSAGYMQMPPNSFDDPMFAGEKYLYRGMIYVSCGCRGRNSVDEAGRLCGKAPMTLIDLKTAVRFLRHFSSSLPGDFSHIISVGTSAGGAMSSLLSITGDHLDYEPYLKEEGAFFDESDAVFAGVIYCPITDLTHADLAYEWQFLSDPQTEESFFAPAASFTDFQKALSRELAKAYVPYFNSLHLVDPKTGETLTIGEDGRSQSGYFALLSALSDSATDYLLRLAKGEILGESTVGDYLKGKEDWLCFDGNRAEISDLDAYLLHHRRRMKPCTAFDALQNNSGENQELGTEEEDFLHFDPYIPSALAALSDAFPAECENLQKSWGNAAKDQNLAWRRRLINPMDYLNEAELSRCKPAAHYRICVGSCDADTSFMISLTLAVRLANLGLDSAYHIVWDQPHCQADYPNEVCDWIEEIVSSG